MNSELNPPLINNNSVRRYWLTVYKKKTRVAVVIKFLVFFWCSRWTRDFIGYEILSLPLIAQSGRWLLVEFILLQGKYEWTLEERCIQTYTANIQISKRRKCQTLFWAKKNSKACILTDVLLSRVYVSCRNEKIKALKIFVLSVSKHLQRFNSSQGTLWI